MERLLVIKPDDEELRVSMLLTSWKICILTVPFSLIWGLTRSVRPTSLRSMVWNGLTAPLLLLLAVYWPVTKGTFWPMTILASSLSSVSKLGVDSTLESPSACKKRASAPRANTPLRR